MTAGRAERSRKSFLSPSSQRANSHCPRSRACGVALRARLFAAQREATNAPLRRPPRARAASMARRRRIIAAAALVCTSALVPLQAPRPRRTVSRYSEAVDEDTLLPSGDAAAAADTDRRPRNGNRQNQGGGRGRIIQLSNPMRLVRKQRPGGDRRGPPGGQRGGGPPQRVGSTGGPVPACVEITFRGASPDSLVDFHTGCRRAQPR